ncbi:hypothetical protein Caka_0601 [Coraliomargarita akajimensis DSM 45221]|uniref:Uncharacterized protein n=1 Tax=Coraliomargarita akajimensis (strain DSM 45221 / IAM 15411 / JCM 23193 / KCTC 12865 / 04OKA010-24) TaxID=583355 RepID=D5ENW7_CORAD|nr:hypothetical protein Caka_0601 [Coraliomargarita akajimensis DSM 45221]
MITFAEPFNQTSDHELHGMHRNQPWHEDGDLYCLSKDPCNPWFGERRFELAVVSKSQNSPEIAASLKKKQGTPYGMPCVKMN